MKSRLLFVPLSFAAALGASRDTHPQQEAPNTPAALEGIDPPWLRTSAAAAAHAALHADGVHAEGVHPEPHPAHDPHFDWHAHPAPHPAHPPSAPDGVAAHAAYSGSPLPPSHHAGRAAPPAPVERSRAKNGYTVEEIFARRQALGLKQIRLRATVVRAIDGVLGKTYLHLQDGTGSLEERTHDLTATTTERFELGETVEVEGRLVLDTDVGLGYRYPALLTELRRVATN